MEKEQLIQTLKHISDSFFKKEEYISAGRINQAIDVINDCDVVLPQADVSGSLVDEGDLVSFGSYLLSDERNHYVKDKKSVHHADIENWKHLKNNIGNQ